MKARPSNPDFLTARLDTLVIVAIILSAIGGMIWSVQHTKLRSACVSGDVAACEACAQIENDSDTTCSRLLAADRSKK